VDTNLIVVTLQVDANELGQKGSKCDVILELPLFVARLKKEIFGGS
jgi:hypothetical protein